MASDERPGGGARHLAVVRHLQPLVDGVGGRGGEQGAAGHQRQRAARKGARRHGVAGHGRHHHQTWPESRQGWLEETN